MRTRVVGIYSTLFTRGWQQTVGQVWLSTIVVLCSVVPEPCYDDGLRRSKRTRVIALEYWRSEQITYRYDKSGMICSRRLIY